MKYSFFIYQADNVSVLMYVCVQERLYNQKKFMIILLLTNHYQHIAEYIYDNNL